MISNVVPAVENNGIISSAIANAEKLPATPRQGKENTSLLQQQAAKKSSPASAQFTFTCDSQVPGTVAWPGPNPSQIKMPQDQSSGRLTTSHATQTSPKVPAPQRQGLNLSQHAPIGQKQTGKQPAPAKTRRRRTAGKEYLMAALQRRRQQEVQNLHHPPAKEDEWVCEFCEYEIIFGTPPEALIREYEIKDRRKRKHEEERRRLLEKAKMKGRKGKKGSRMASKNAATERDHQAHQQPPQHQQHPNQNQSQGTQSEEYYEEDYDEEDYIQEEDPPMSPGHPAPDLAVYREQLAQAEGVQRPQPPEQLVK
jgi:hypothetical protein